MNQDDGDAENLETWTYSYDHKNQLVKVEHWETDPDYTNPTATLLKAVEYKYDVFGNRAQKDVDEDGDGDTDTTEKYVYDGWKNTAGRSIGTEHFDVLFDLADDGSLTTRYVRGDVIDEVFARIEGSDAYWYLPDHQGSTREIADASGAVAERLKYDGFGNLIEVLDDEDTPIAEAQFAGRYRYTGREYDVEIRLQYNRARWYDPAIGRWISEDPLGFDAGDSNLSRYVNNRPTVSTDPSGLQEPEPSISALPERHSDPYSNGRYGPIGRELAGSSCRRTSRPLGRPPMQNSR